MLLTAAYLPLRAQQATYFEAWVKSEGTQLTETQNELLRRIASITDPNSNLYVASSTYNETTMVYDLLLTSYTDAGTPAWSQQFNIPGGGEVFVGGLALDGQGNVLFTGAVDNGTNGYDALTVKFTSSGAVAWYKTWNGAANDYDGGAAIAADALGTVFITGVASQSAVPPSMDFLTVAYSTAGTQLWAATYNHAGLTDAAARLIVSGGYLVSIGGVQVNANNWALASLRYDPATGNLLGSAVISGNIVLDEINGFTTDAGDNIYIAGARANAQSGYDFLTVKLDSNLNLLWQAVHDSSGGKDVAKAVGVDTAGNVIVTGYTTTAGGQDYLTLKYNAAGVLQWSDAYNGKASQDDAATDVVVDDAGNAFVTGHSNETGNDDYFTIWYDPTGTRLWSARFNSVYNSMDIAAVIRMDGQGDLLVTGRTTALDYLSQESVKTTTVKYKRADIVIPPDGEAQSSAIYYIKNNGQLLNTDQDSVPDIKFYSAHTYPGFYFFADKVSMVLSLIDDDTVTVDTMHRVDMSFYGSPGRNYGPFSLQELENYNTYFLRHIPEGRTRVPLFGKLIYSEVYTSIDVQYSSNWLGEKMYFIVKPGGDTSDIRLAFDGEDDLDIDGNGNLIIATSIEDIVFSRPDAYQIDAQGDTVNLNWQPNYFIDNGKVGFTLGTYNDELPLVIRIRKDETPSDFSSTCMDNWVTYYGTILPDRGKDIELNEGNLYVYVEASSPEFPGITGSSLYSSPFGQADVLIGAFDGNYEPIWATYFGGSLQEYATEMAFNSIGDIYFTGSTESDDLPQSSQPQDKIDAFVARINNSGTELKWSSYLGGDYRDYGYGIAVNSNNHVFIVGRTSSESSDDFPLLNKPGAYNQTQLNNYTSGYGTPDAFILEFDENNSQIWGTYFGGQYWEAFADIAINPANDDIFILGETNTAINYSQSTPCGVPTSGSGEFPTCSPGSGVFFQNYGGVYQGSPGNVDDLMLVQFDKSGELKWSTYIGGNRSENAIFFGNQIRRIGKISISPYDPDELTIVGYSNNVGAFPYHVQGSAANAYNQQDVEISPLLIKFSNRDISWSTGFTCGDTEPITEYGMTYGTDGELFLSAITNCYDPQTETSLFCKVPTNGLFPICPPNDDAFFQDDDVLDCTVEEAEYRGGNELYIVGFNPDNEMIYSSYFGGSGGEIIGELAYSGSTLFMTGYTASATNFPLIDPGDPAYFQDIPGLGYQDAFIAGLNVEDVYITEVVNEEFSSPPLNVAPNPSSGKVILSMSQRAQNSINVCITDTTGRIIYQSTYELKRNNSLSLDLSFLSPGLYFAQLTDGDYYYHTKILIQ